MSSVKERIKPVDYLEANAVEIVRSLAEQGEPLIITQDGEAKAVLQDIDSYERTQETLALLKILALGNKRISEGQTISAAEAVHRLRNRRKDKI